MGCQASEDCWTYRACKGAKIYGWISRIWIPGNIVDNRSCHKYAWRMKILWVCRIAVRMIACNPFKIEVIINRALSINQGVFCECMGHNKAARDQPI